MKAKGEDKSIQGIAYDIPVSLHKALSELAKKNKWSMKKELIQAIEEHIDGSSVKLDPTIKKLVEMFAEKNSFTITEAVNYLVSSKISVAEWFQDTVIEEANKDYKKQITDYYNQEIAEYNKQITEEEYDEYKKQTKN